MDSFPDRRADADAPFVEELRALEPIFHRAGPGAGRVTFERMTAPAFWEVGASGKVYAREYVLDTLEARHDGPIDDPWEIRDFAARNLQGDLWLVTYELDQAGRASRRSTIWRHTEDGWLAEYHQGTLA